MRTTKGYILTGGAAILLLFVVILSHILLNKDTLLPLVDNALDSIVPKSYIKYSTRQVNLASYLVIDANNVELQFVDSIAPNMSDSDIVLSVPAAFTGERLDYYKPFNICGNYVVNGVAKRGFSSKYCTGYCASYADTLIISSSSKTDANGEKSISVDKNSAVECKGSFFQQLILVYNGVVAEYIPFNKLNFYRAVCVGGDSKVAIVQSLDKVTCTDFSKALVQMGYTNALYLDMGNWAWGWLREDSGSIYELSYKYPDTQYQTNWLILKKR